jgi:fatty acid desaturase
MDTLLSPRSLIALAAALFVLGCVIAMFWPHRWWLALLAILPSIGLTVWVVFGPELRAFFDMLVTLL